MLQALHSVERAYDFRHSRLHLGKAPAHLSTFVTIKDINESTQVSRRFKKKRFVDFSNVLQVKKTLETEEHAVFRYIEYVCVVYFIIEYCTRLIVRWKCYVKT